MWEAAAKLLDIKVEKISTVFGEIANVLEGAMKLAVIDLAEEYPGKKVVGICAHDQWFIHVEDEEIDHPVFNLFESMYSDFECRALPTVRCTMNNGVLTVDNEW